MTTDKLWTIRLADGTLAETEGEIDTWNTRDEAEEFLAAAQSDRYIGDDYAGASVEDMDADEVTTVTRGSYIYRQIDDYGSTPAPIHISTRNSRGEERYLGVIYARDGDWKHIICGSDPVKDGWEDGRGNLVRDLVNLDDFVSAIIRHVTSSGHHAPSTRRVEDDILEANELVSPGDEWNGISWHACDVEAFAAPYEEASE